MQRKRLGGPRLAVGGVEPPAAVLPEQFIENFVWILAFADVLQRRFESDPAFQRAADQSAVHTCPIQEFSTAERSLVRALTNEPNFTVGHFYLGGDPRGVF